MFHKKLLSEFKENKRLVAGMVFSQWVMLLANIFLMLNVAEFVQLCVTETNDVTEINEKAVRLILVLIVVILIRAAMTYWNSKLSFRASTNVKHRLRTMIYDKLMKLGSSYHKEFQSSEIVQLSTEGVEQLEIYFGKYVPQFFYSMLAPVTLFVIVGTMSIKVAVILLICVPLIPISIVAVQKFAKKMLAKYWGTYTQMGDSFLECLQGLTTLKIYQADGHYAKKMDEEAEVFRKVTMRVLVMQLNSISIMDLVAYGGAALGAILSILEYQKGAVTLSQCFFMIMISAEFFLPLRLLGSFFHIAMNGNAAADKIFKLLDYDKNHNSNVKMISLDKDFTIRGNNIHFGYEEDEVLKGVDFKLEPGLTALVGESGCGKSTLSSLLMRNIAPNAGEIYIGEANLQQLDEKVLYRNITRIRHDSYLFAGTIRQNLLMGKENATEEELWQVLQKVHLMDFVKENGGLDYEIKEKASNLSGGQKQRLALARALLHDSQVYIFDEATSNVDVESENAIMEVVKELAKEKIVLIISHRLANVISADCIYVIKDGKIAEQGKQKSLIEENGYYASLFYKQQELEQFGKGDQLNEESS